MAIGQLPFDKARITQFVNGEIAVQRPVDFCARQIEVEQALEECGDLRSLAKNPGHIANFFGDGDETDTCGEARHASDFGKIAIMSRRTMRIDEFIEPAGETAGPWHIANRHFAPWLQDTPRLGNRRPVRRAVVQADQAQRQIDRMIGNAGELLDRIGKCTEGRIQARAKFGIGFHADKRHCTVQSPIHFIGQISTRSLNIENAHLRRKRDVIQQPVALIIPHMRKVAHRGWCRNGRKIVRGDKIRHRLSPSMRPCGTGAPRRRLNETPMIDHRILPARVRTDHTKAATPNSARNWRKCVPAARHGVAFRGCWRMV